MFPPSHPDTDAVTGAFGEELQVRAAEAGAQVRAAEALGDELQASIASSDLADLRSLATRNDVELDEPYPAKAVADGEADTPG